ncbi:MAG TPA: PGPGW domain-containing protein [Gammaproteobacteria bacterium]|nr:PGPGW domain-containing protein [Gammaproteobacteria bacterium]
MVKTTLQITYQWARRIVIGLVGFTVLLLGTVMLITPGPALVVIPVGLAILGIEFAWARTWLRKIRDKVEQGGGKIKSAWKDRRENKQE